MTVLIMSPYGFGMETKKKYFSYLAKLLRGVSMAGENKIKE